MPVAKEETKIVLVQLRSLEATRQLDFASYVRASHLAPSNFVAIDVHTQAPTTDLLEGAHALIIAGSRYSVWDEVPHLAELIALIRAAKERNVPMLGVCFGAQLIAHVFGGKVERDAEHGEWGTVEVTTTEEAHGDNVFSHLPPTFPAQEAHQDRITELPPGAILLATTPACQVQAFHLPSANAYATQFHPERSKQDFERSMAIDETPANAAKHARMRSTLKETPEAESVIEKFISHIALPISPSPIESPQTKMPLA